MRSILVSGVWRDRGPSHGVTPNSALVRLYPLGEGLKRGAKPAPPSYRRRSAEPPQIGRSRASCRLPRRPLQHWSRRKNTIQGILWRTHRTNKKKLVARVRRIAGQIGAIERAIESDTDCSQIFSRSLRSRRHGRTAGRADRGHLRHHVAHPN
nr:metal-sensing transcriptional repressor [Brevundimonas diminuta]